MHLQRLRSPLCAGFAAAALALAAQAQLASPRPPDWRGADCAVYAGFGQPCPAGFSEPAINPNAADDPATTGGFAPTLTQLTPGAILTSTCNIYHPSLTPQFRIAGSTPAGEDIQEVVLQVRSAGNPRDDTSFTLDIGDGPLAPDVFELIGAAPAPEERLVVWDVNGVAGSASTFTIDFQGTASNIGLDIVELDVRIGECPTGTALCFGDGSSLACPCGNAGSAGNGCAHPQNPSGANLAASGTPAANDVAFAISGLNPAGAPTVLMIRSTSLGAGAVFGDGILCLSTPVVRFGATFASGGAATVPVSHGAGPGTFVYQAWYRSNPATFCDPFAAFNLTNAYQIVWP